MIGMEISLGKNKRSWDAFMEVVTFELRCEEGALEMQERAEKGRSPRLGHE